MNFFFFYNLMLFFHNLVLLLWYSAPVFCAKVFVSKAAIELNECSINSSSCFLYLMLKQSLYWLTKASVRSHGVMVRAAAF